jgi:hypothetical protein
VLAFTLLIKLARESIDCLKRERAGKKEKKKFGRDSKGKNIQTPPTPF